MSCCTEVSRLLRRPSQSGLKGFEVADDEVDDVKYVIGESHSGVKSD